MNPYQRKHVAIAVGALVIAGWQGYEALRAIITEQTAEQIEAELDWREEQEEVEA